LRFDAANCPAIPEPVYRRLIVVAGRKMTQDGVIVLTANRFRSRERNRQDALDRLIEMIREAAIPPKHRRATRPTLASKKRRIEGKKRRSDVKAGRGRVDEGS
jgi:ribosome-associated protein